MRVARLYSAFGLVVLSLHALAGAAQAQYDDERAPRIYVSTPMGTSVGTSYVEPLISLSEDAYVFAISVDVDRNIRVLHPELPGISVRMNSQRDLHLPNFFAGYGDRRRETGFRNRGYASTSYDGYDAGYTDSRGTVIALASRRPFDLDEVTRDGDWDLAAVSRLIGNRDPQSAASALARTIGARGEPIGRGLYRFAGAARFYSTLYNTASYQCNPYYGAFGYSSGISYFRASQLRQAGYLVRFIGVDVCGQPRFAVHSQGVVPNPGQRPPASGAFPRSRIPVVVPRNPTRGRTVSEDANGANAGASDRYVERMMPRTSPRNPVAERRPGVDRPRSQPARGSFPERARTVPVQPRSPAAEPVRHAPPPERVQRAERPRPEARPRAVTAKTID